MTNKWKREPERQAFTLSAAPVEDIENILVGFQWILAGNEASGGTEVDETMPSVIDPESEKESF